MIVKGIPDLTRPRASSLFFKNLLLSSGGGEQWGTNGSKLKTTSGYHLDKVLESLGLPTRGFILFGDRANPSTKVPTSLTNAEHVQSDGFCLGGLLTLALLLSDPKVRSVDAPRLAAHAKQGRQRQNVDMRLPRVRETSVA